MKLPDVSLLKSLTQGPLEKARALAAEGRLDKAIATLESSLAKQPDHEGMLLELSRCLLASARETDAGECLKRILRKNPRRIDTVLEFIEEIKMKHAAVGSYYDAVVEHFIRMEDFAKAMDTMERISVEELRVYHGRHLAKWEAVKKNAPQAKLTKTSLHSAYFVTLALERLGDSVKAAEAYRRILEKNPEEADRVCSRLESILARDYQNLPLRFALVDLLLKSGKLAESLKHLEHSLEADAAAAAANVAARAELIARKLPGRPEVFWLLARSRRAEGKFAEMLQALDALQNLGSLRTESIALLEELTPKMDDFPPLRLALADAYLASGKPVLAVEAVLLASEKIGDDATVAALEKVARAHPQHARTYLLLGDLDFKAGRGAEGVARYEKVLQLSPEDGPILVPKLLALLDAGSCVVPVSQALARIYLREGERTKAALLLRYRLAKDPDAAAEVMARATEALAAEPAHVGSGLALAEAHLAAGSPLQALPALEAILSSARAPAPEALRCLSRIARSSPEGAAGSLPLLRKVATLEGIPAAAARFAVGEAALLSGALGEAVSAFRELAAAAPERLDDVRQIFETLLAGNPEMVEVRYVLAGLCLDQKNYRAAVHELKKIQSLNPDLLAPILTKYREAIKAAPTDIEIRLGLSSAFLLSGQLEEVVSLASETLRLKDDSSTACLQLDLGDVALQKGDPTAAVKRYYNASRKNPDLRAEAAQRLARLLDLQPNFPLASLALGKILPGTGRVEEGVSRLLEAFRNDNRISEGVLTELDRIRAEFPVSPHAAEARIEILCALGKDAQAVEAIQSLLEGRPASARSLLPRLQTILERSPRLPAAHLAMGRAQGILGEIALASEACRSACRVERAVAPQVIRLCSELGNLHPKAIGPYLVMAEIYLADGEIAAAAEKLSQATARGEGPLDEVLALLETTVAKDSGTARVAFLAAEILAKAGRTAAAARAYRKALGRDAGLVEPALKGLNALVEKEPRLGEARLIRAQALILQQDNEAALEDLEVAARSAPALLSETIAEARKLHERKPGGYRLVSLLSEMLLAAQRQAEAADFLASSLERSFEPGERLVLLVRLWRARLSRGETAAAREALREAEGLTTDRDHLMARVHECIVAQLRREIATLQEASASTEPRAADRVRLAETLLELGEAGEAAAVAAANADGLDEASLRRIHAGAAAQQEDYFRAAELLKGLGPSRPLAHAALRSGDAQLACRTLEEMTGSSADPEIQDALRRAYTRLVTIELEPGSAKLMGETILRFGRNS